MLSLLRLERKQKKNYSNPFRNRTFLFLSYLSGIETTTTFIMTAVVPSKSIPDSRPKSGAKCIPVFRTKRRRNPTRWGGTYLYGSYKGVPTSEINSGSLCGGKSHDHWTVDVLVELQKASNHTLLSQTVFSFTIQSVVSLFIQIFCRF